MEKEDGSVSHSSLTNKYQVFIFLKWPNGEADEQIEGEYMQGRWVGI